MRRPNVVERFTGTPIVACVLVPVFGLVLYGWFESQVPGLLALMAGLCLTHTLSSVGTLRRYKAWRAGWDAMGDLGTAPPEAADRVRWKLMSFAALLLIAMPAAWRLPEVRYNPELSVALHWVWASGGVYMLFRMLQAVLRGVSRLIRRGGKGKADQARDAVVELAVGRTLDSPTRADAERSLPDYCLRLIRGD